MGFLSGKIEWPPFHLCSPVSTTPFEHFVTHSSSSTLHHSSKHAVEGRSRELLPSLEVFLVCVHGSQVPPATSAFSHSPFPPMLMSWVFEEDEGLDREPTNHIDQRKLSSFLCCRVIPLFLCSRCILCRSFPPVGDSGAQCGHSSWMQGEMLIVFNRPFCCHLFLQLPGAALSVLDCLQMLILQLKLLPGQYQWG